MSGLAALAPPLLPADPARRGVVVDAGAVVPDDADVVVWGRLGAGSGSALGHAARREAELRRLRAGVPAPLRVTAVHRLGASGTRTGVRGRARSALRGGVLVEMAGPGAGPRVLDTIAAITGATPDGAMHAGAGGTLIVPVRLEDGGRAILRLGRAGTPGDPAPAAETVARLAVAAGPRLPVAPPLLRGTLAGTSWTLERALPGRRPARLTGALLRQAAAACALLPAGPGPPRSVLDDLRGAAALLPAHAAALTALADALAEALAPLPAVPRHGDLWTGNLLVARGTLTGIVDWDAAHPAGVPGADLVQLVGSDWRRRRRRPLGGAVLERSWLRRVGDRDAAAYWAAVGLRPTDDLLDVAVAAWWASEVHHTVLRFPRRASDAAWLAANVGAVLDGFARGPAAVLSPRAAAPSGRSGAAGRRSTLRAPTRG
jgi:hypothetical protein